MKSVRILGLALGQHGHNASPIRQHAKGGRIWGLLSIEVGFTPSGGVFARRSELQTRCGPRNIASIAFGSVLNTPLSTQ